MLHLLLALYSLLFFVFAWRRFDWAVYFFILSLPTYLIRFNFGPLPSTVLELEFGILLLIWLIKFTRTDWPELKQFFRSNIFFFVLFLLFFFSSIAGILISDQWYISLGQWRAYFLEPMLIFVMLIGRKKSLSVSHIISSLVGSTIMVSLLAIAQKISPIFYPPSLWDDQTFGRATSFFTTPNAIPLFILPPLFAGFYLLRSADRIQKIGYVIALCLGLVALVASKSFGGVLALGAGTLALIYFGFSKKLALIASGVCLVLLVVTSSLLPTLKFTSMQNRFTLWRHSATFLSKSPKNFILGAGIRQYFRKIEKPYYNPKELERLIYPHNIFLNFWAEIGLFGLIGFAGILYSLFSLLRPVLQSSKLLGASLISAFVVLVAHGLIDVPYFKNDLAFLFWLLVSLVAIANTKSFADNL